MHASCADAENNGRRSMLHPTRQVPRVFKYSVPLQYADDISFWITGSNTSAIVTKLQSDLQSLDSHLDDIGLKLNPTKTKFMVIRKPNTYDDFANSVLTCKGEQIEVVQQAKNTLVFSSMNTCTFTIR